jgi:hypothetical protein
MFGCSEDEIIGGGAIGETAVVVDVDLANCKFHDVRLGRRLQRLVRQLANRLGQPIPFACQDWSNTKAAYRFLSNRKVREAAILSGHFAATADRTRSTEGPVLVLQDTTEFTFSEDSMAGIGLLAKSFKGRGKQYARCGILMHSSLAVTPEGLPLGLTAVKFWTQNKSKGANALKRSVNPTRVPIEQKESIRWLENLKWSTMLLGAPRRCVHIGDRESDIYELFCTAEENDTNFLIRTCVDGLAGDGSFTIAAAMAKAKVKAKRRVEIRDAKGTMVEVVLAVKYQRPQILPPIGKQSKYPPLTLTVIHAQEESATPAGREKINWRLITNLSVCSRKDALKKLSCIVALLLLNLPILNAFVP